MQHISTFGRACVLAAALLATFVSTPAIVLAEADGSFSGTVVDPSGSIVSGATVVAVNERTGEARVVVANADGRYVLTGLRPSIYTIKVTVQGFAPIEYTGVQLAAAQEFPLDLTLQAAGVTEAVTVKGNATSMDLSSARIGVNVTEREVLNLPVNGRQMSQLMLQAPGSQNAGTGTWNDVRFSGRANQQNVIKFDGVEGSAIIDAAPGNMAGQIASPFKLQASLENVQEFRVESNNYPAEYGTGTGGQVSVITKSGSNRLSGSLFEYYRDDAFDAPNYFDSTRNSDGSVIQALPKSALRQHQFGGSLGMPIIANRAFLFASYEGYRLDAGVNFVEAAPSAASWSRAVPAIAALRPGFTAPGAVLLPGASANADFDIFQLQTLETVEENSVSVRLDQRFGSQWSSYVRVFHDRGTQLRPEGISGRTVQVTNNPTNAIFNLQGTLNAGLLNEFKVGYNAPQARISGVAPVVNGIDFGNHFNLSGSIANTGIAGQSASSGIVVPGGLVRANSATNGRAAIYDPWSIALANTLTLVRGNHLTKVGGDARLIRMSFDQLGGTTYSFANLAAFLANQPSASSTPATSARRASSTTVRPGSATPASSTTWLRPGRVEAVAAAHPQLRTALRLLHAADGEGRPVREVQPRNRRPRSEHGQSARHEEEQLPAARVGHLHAGKTVLRGGFGMFVGPGQSEDLIQPIESDRVNTTLSTGTLLAFPINTDALGANFTNNPTNRSYQPRAYAADYTIPEKVYQYTASMQRELGGGLTATAAYVGSQGRNLFLRSVTNQIVDVVTNPNPASAAFVIREFARHPRRRRSVRPMQNPYAEVDYKTSGGHDEYNAMKLSLNRRSTSGLAVNVQYTLGESPGNTAGSNEALTAGNIARTLEEFEYDNGYNSFDVRHTFNLSALYSLPFGTAATARRRRLAKALLGGWDVGGIMNARSGIPLDVRMPGPTWSIRTRRRRLHEPGGGPHGRDQHPRRRRLARRPAPDLVPGVDPYIGRRTALPEPGGIRHAGSRRVRQPRPQRASTGRASSSSTCASQAVRRRRAAAT